MNETKICKYCKTEIPKDAKICPNCRKKQKGKLGIIIAVIVVLIIIGGAAGGGSDKSTSNDSPKTETTAKSDSNTAEEVKEAEPEIEYTAVTKQELSDALKANALKAADTYKDQYLEVSGYLDVIDSSGKYISINAGDDDYTFVNVQCFIKNDDQKSIVMDLNTGDALTIKGKCTDVGELIGYSIDIDEIIVE